MSVTTFFVDALGGALELGIATPDDVLKHVTPDVLAQHLPRSIWARLLGACLAAPKVDARLVVDTIGVADLCANMPGTILWAVLADVANRALGKGLVASPPPPAAKEGGNAVSAAAVPTPVAASPSRPFGPVTRPATSPGASRPSTPVTPATGVPVVTVPPSPSGANRAVTVTATQTTAAPAPTAAVDIVFDDDDDEPAPLEAPPMPSRVAADPAPRSRNGSRPPTGAGASTRRPQANASVRPGSRTSPPSSRRPVASSDFDLDTDVSMDGTSRAAEVEVDDDQLVDWSASEETVTSGGDHRRKR